MLEEMLNLAYISKMKLLKLVMVLALGAVTIAAGFYIAKGPNGADRKISGRAADEESPSMVFKRYWTASREGTADEAAQLTAAPPKVFFVCYYISAAECTEKIAKESQRPKLPVEPEPLVSTFDPVVRERVPAGIKNGLWSEYTINREQVYQDQARLNISVKGAGSAIIKDVLFYKTAGGWRVIKIVDPGTIPSYAAFEFGSGSEVEL
jgi:hypothetical protein